MALRYKSGVSGAGVPESSHNQSLHQSVHNAATSSSVMDSVETVESQRQTNPSYSRTARIFPRRRKGLKKSMLRAQFRRLLLRLRRNPTLAWTLAVASLVLALVLCLALAVFLYSKIGSSTKKQPELETSFKNLPIALGKAPPQIVFGNKVVSMEIASIPKRIEDYLLMKIPDYGDLEIRFMEEETGQRQIFRDMTSFETESDDESSSDEDDEEGYYAFDDDFERSAPVSYNHLDKLDSTHKLCRRVQEHRLNLQNCNSIHELGYLESNYKYLNEGAYRQVFAVDHSYGNSLEKFAIKDLSYENHVEYDNFEFVRMDAIVAERLSSNPRTFDIFGFCGLSILSEYFAHGDIEPAVLKGNGYMKTIDLDDKDEVKPQNNLTAVQKLVVALEMAEGIADLHGYNNALIIHDDVQLSQFLFNSDKTMLKLNDFNRAEFALWDDKNQEYCRYKNGKGHGNWRSPEEYKDEPLTEKIDIWSLGCNFYALLTGLGPLHDIRSHKKYQGKIKDGEKPYTDPRYRTRSTAEESLATIIEKCFEYKADDRPSIFEVVDYLKEAVAANLIQFQTRTSVLQTVETKW